MIIGASGFAGSGKTELSRYLVQKHGFTALSFADGVKDAVAAVFNWPREALQGATKEDRVWREAPEPFWSAKMGKPVTPRWAMQFLGTNLIRDQLFKDIWAQRVAHIIVTNPTKDYVIDDVRFQNERQILAELGAQFIFISRDAVTNSNPHYRTLWSYWMGDDEVKELVDPNAYKLALDTLHPSEYDWLQDTNGANTSLLRNDGDKIETWQNTIEHWCQESFPVKFSGSI